MQSPFLGEHFAAVHKLSSTCKDSFLCENTIPKECMHVWVVLFTVYNFARAVAEMAKSFDVQLLKDVYHAHRCSVCE